jgi:hypothetical protein
MFFSICGENRSGRSGRTLGTLLWVKLEGFFGIEEKGLINSFADS